MKSIYTFMLAGFFASSAYAGNADAPKGDLNCQFRRFASSGVIPVDKVANPPTTLNGNTLIIDLDTATNHSGLQTTGTKEDYNAFLRCGGNSGGFFEQTLHFPTKTRLKKMTLFTDFYLDDVTSKARYLLQGKVITNGRGDEFKQDKNWNGVYNASVQSIVNPEGSSVCGTDLTVHIDELTLETSRPADVFPVTAYATMRVSRIELEFGDANGPGCVQGNPVSGSTATAEPGPGFWEIKGGYSNKCLDVRDHSTENGARLQQWDCTGEAHQKYNLVDVGGGWYNIVSSISGRCVSSAAGSQDNGTPMVIWDCGGGNDQKVRFQKNGNGYKVIFASSNKCMDVQDTSFDNGKEVHQWDCGNSVPDQNWYFVPQ